MTGRPARKRGRPPKAVVLERPKKFQYHLLKKPKYLLNQENKGSETPNSQDSTPTHSRGASPDISDISNKNSRSFRHKQRLSYGSVSKRGGKSVNYGRHYNFKSAAEKSSDYHYGSDFEDDFEEMKSESEMDDNIDIDPDAVLSDDCDSDSSNHSSDLPKNKVSYIKPPSPDPLWLQEIDLPPLDLPKSSEDLLVPKEYIMKTLSIYEVLRHFRNLARLSPFRLEEFCGALMLEEQNVLLVEIHIMLLKAIFREEDSQQTHFGPLDQKDSVNACIYFIDPMTWPEVLRSYVESDKSFDHSILDILIPGDYPFCGVEKRLKVLQFLTDQFLVTNPVREDLISEGPIHYDDHCRICHRLGDLLCCETCPAVYHLECVEPPLNDVPEEDWQCNICKSHRTSGVTDCIIPAEKTGTLSRHEHLGFDRHGRKYWFLCRRIFVEKDDGEVWYYSTKYQLDELLDKLDENSMEKTLYREITNLKDVILKHMSITETVTNSAKAGRKSYLEVENAEEMNRILAESERTDQNEIPTLAGEAEIETEEVPLALQELENLRLTRYRAQQIASGTFLFKLGQDNNCKNYVNQYTSNIYALNKPQRNEERDKKRHLSHKFSLTAASEFKWAGSVFGPKALLINTLRQTILQLESNIPTSFLHVNWPLLRKTWIACVQSCIQPKDFGKALVVLQACIKPVVYASVWHEQLGHVRLHRVTAIEREERKKIEKREKKEKEDEEERNRLAINFVKYTLGLKHSVQKQKGEEYRIHGQWGWRWLSSTRKLIIKDARTMGLRAGPQKIMVQVKDGIKEVSNESNQQEWSKESETDKRLNNLRVFRPIMEFETIDVTKALTSPGRLQYPKIAKKSKLDDFLLRRSNLKLLEERKFIQMGMVANSSCQEMDSKKLDSDIDVEALDEDKKNFDFASSSTNQDKLIEIAQEILVCKKRYKEVSTSKTLCYSVSCRNNSSGVLLCYSPLCILQNALKAKLATLLKSAQEITDSQTLQNVLITTEKNMKNVKENATGELNEAAKKELVNAVATAKNVEDDSIDFSKVSSKLEVKEEVPESYLEEEVISMDTVICGEEVVTTDDTMKKEEEIDIENDSPNKIIGFDSGQTIKSNMITNGQAVKSEGLLNKILSVKKTEVSEDLKQNVKGGLSKSGLDNFKVLEKVKLEDGSEVERVYSVTDTRGKIYLKKLTTAIVDRRRKKTPVKYPLYSTFLSKHGQYSLMILPKSELRKLARNGGKLTVNGFHHLAKSNTWQWPYPNSKPLFKTCWLYRTTTIQSIPAISLQLRILWACLRWDDMQVKPQSTDGKNQVTTDTEIMTLEILKHRHLGENLEKTQYLRRKIVIPLELPKTIREVNPIRSGLRKRKREETPQNTEPQVSEEWVDEDKLELWEIKQYCDKLEKTNNMTLTRSRTGTLTPKTEIKIEASTIKAENIITKGTPEEIKEKMEMQLRAQRAAHYQKKSVETMVKTTGGQIIKLLPATRKIYMSKDGTAKVVTSPATLVQKTTAAGNLQQSLIKIQPQTDQHTFSIQGGHPQRVQIIRGNDGKIQVRGLVPGQQLIQMADGKLHVLTGQISSQTQPSTTVGGQSTLVQTPSNTKITRTEGSGITSPAQIIVKNAQGQQVRVVPSGQNLKQQLQQNFHKSIILKQDGTKVVLSQPQQTTQNIFAGQTFTPNSVVMRGNQVIGTTNEKGQVVITSRVQNLIPRNDKTQSNVAISNQRPIAVSVSNASTTSLASTVVQNSTLNSGTVNQTDAPALIQSGSVVVNNPVLAQQLAEGKLQLATLNGQQVLIRTTSTNNALNTNSQTSATTNHLQKLLSPTKSAQSSSPSTPKSSNVQVSATQDTPISSQNYCKTQTGLIQITQKDENSESNIMTEEIPSRQLVQQQLRQQVLRNQRTASAKLSVSSNQKILQSRLQGSLEQNVNSEMIEKTSNESIVESSAEFNQEMDAIENSDSNNESQVEMRNQSAETQENNPLASTVLVDHNSEIERQLLVSQPPGTIIKCVTAQVIQTSEGPRIVLQGIQGADFTPQQLNLVQQQVKQQLLKNQATTGKQGVLGPTKIYLAVQPPPQTNQSGNSPVNEETLLTPQNQKILVKQNTAKKTLSGNQSVIVRQNANSHIENVAENLETEETTDTDNNSKQMEASPTKDNSAAETLPKENCENQTPDGQQQKKFILTHDYIHQTIKNALKQENLNPEIEEKLIQLQRYQEKQMKNEPVNPVITRPQPRKRPSSVQGNNHDYEISLLKIFSPTKADGIDEKNSRSRQKWKENQEEKRRQAAQSKLNVLLFRHKELLKKDILKKRALLEKELQIDIQREISVELSSRSKQHENKTEEVIRTGSGKRKSVPVPAAALQPPKSGSRGVSGRPKNQTGKKEKLYCVCRTPYDDTKFYVGCDLCHNWYHGDCVGITESMSKRMTEFVCTECRHARETKELYCLCKQPYDESQFYICCDKCQDWFHGRCVGILQSEADNIDEYICPNCQVDSNINFANMKKLNNRDYEALKKLVKQMQGHKSAWPFMEPVDPTEAPDYYKVIKEPMDLQTVELRINEKHYKNLSEFIGDVTKLFDNCRYYNSKESPFFRCAEGLESFFVQKVKGLREKIVENK
ncbi:fetal alzheimer antigen, falz, putative [Pediculus humanus corporis]|uniref:Fetal alzheimer antigen, falz, putative n=1 Tax=Pediculus humanus subsp. corporis TaxID=121224 RepID=E0VMX5_PEDHC|nr:fetal alzheimer antigen, falz, putative [Pediculus humanus corporis]EEB14731.1 fetal alzheimer antigen, falz, putative [Pediculus humanus corporis]